MKKIMRILTVLFLSILLLVVAGISYLSIREYQPQAIESIDSPRSNQEITGQSVSLLTYNIGYAGLSVNEDFFMDGGTGVQPKDQQLIETNLAGITTILKENPADIYLLQEVDRQSKRSYQINQEDYLKEQLALNSVFAYNFKVDYVPYPWPPIGQVESGLATLTNLDITEANRLALPVPFSWPVRLANLKRGLLETRFSIAGSDKELVVFNLHLEAYDSGEGKVAQSQKLAQILADEYQKGNYVIAGGDFNQIVEGSREFPTLDDAEWVPGTLAKDDLPEHFSFAFDDSYPTARLLNTAYTYDYETSQVYILDGFIISDNLKVDTVQVINTDFEYTDHQPVKLELQLIE